MKILLLKFRNIGDVLLITPLVSNLKAYFEEAQTGNRMVAEFALRMVNAPETLFEWGVGAYTESMDQIRKHPYFFPEKN